MRCGCRSASSPTAWGTRGGGCSERSCSGFGRCRYQRVVATIIAAVSGRLGVGEGWVSEKSRLSQSWGQEGCWGKKMGTHSRMRRYHHREPANPTPCIPSATPRSRPPSGAMPAPRFETSPNLLEPSGSGFCADRLTQPQAEWLTALTAPSVSLRRSTAALCPGARSCRHRRRGRPPRSSSRSAPGPGGQSRRASPGPGSPGPR